MSWFVWISGGFGCYPVLSGSLTLDIAGASVGMFDADLVFSSLGGDTAGPRNLFCTKIIFLLWVFSFDWSLFGWVMILMLDLIFFESTLVFVSRPFWLGDYVLVLHLWL